MHYPPYKHSKTKILLVQDVKSSKFLKITSLILSISLDARESVRYDLTSLSVTKYMSSVTLLHF